MSCHFLLQWTTFYQKSSLSLVCLGFPCTTWLIASLSYASHFTTTRLWPMKAQRLFSSVRLLWCVWPSATPWTAAHQASLSISNSWSLLKLMSIELVMPSNHLILCCPLLFLPSIFPSIRVFSNESTLYIRWPKYWSFSFSISPSKEYSGLISFRMDSLDLLDSKGFSRVFSNTIVQKNQFFSAQQSL